MGMNLGRREFLVGAGALTLTVGEARSQIPVAASDRYRHEVEDFAEAILQELGLDAAAVQALFGAGRAQPVPTLDSVFEGLADYVQAHFESDVLDALIR